MIAGEDRLPRAAQRHGRRLRDRRRAGRADRARGLAPADPPRPAVRLEEVDAFAGHLVVHQRSDGLTQLRILELGDDGLADDYLVEFDERGLHRRLRRQPGVRPAGGPARLHDHGQPGGGLQLRRPHPRADPAPADPRARRLRPRRLRGAPALGDRRRRRAGADLDRGQARLPRGLRRRHPPVPVLLYGYGAYETSMDPYFSVARLSLLDRGAGFAIAHVRGGGEMGRHWYDDGKLLRKQNTFSDFVACARHLVAERLDHPRPAHRRGRQRRRPADRSDRQPGSGAVRPVSWRRSRSSTPSPRCSTPRCR